MVKMFDSYGLKDATARYSSLIEKKFLLTSLIITLVFQN